MSAMVSHNERDGADQRKHQSSVPLASVKGIHQCPVNSPHNGPATREKFSIWWRHHEFIRLNPGPVWIITCMILLFCKELYDMYHTSLLCYMYMSLGMPQIAENSSGVDVMIMTYTENVTLTGKLTNVEPKQSTIKSLTGYLILVKQHWQYINHNKNTGHVSDIRVLYLNTRSLHRCFIFHYAVRVRVVFSWCYAKVRNEKISFVRH